MKILMGVGFAMVIISGGVLAWWYLVLKWHSRQD
jgi:hypothetical protein